MVAYNEQLADRIRELLVSEAEVSERKMFGGLAFLIAGNMAVTASGEGGLMVRVDPEQSAALVAGDGVCHVEMRGRTMSGWLRVDDDELVAEQQLAEWVQVGVAYAKTLPAK